MARLLLLSAVGQMEVRCGGPCRWTGGVWVLPRRCSEACVGRKSQAVVSPQLFQGHFIPPEGGAEWGEGSQSQAPCNGWRGCGTEPC